MPTEVTKTPEGLALGMEKRDHRQMCKYGENCYQKNPMHHQKFRHPVENEDKKKETGLPPGNQKEDKVTSKEELKTKGENSGKGDTTENKIEETGESPSKKPKIVEESKPEKFTDGETVKIADLLKLDNRQRIKKVYGVEMPEDFFSFWDFCIDLNREDPWESLSGLFGLQLTGPFLLLADETLKKKSWILDRESILVNDLICHGRYYRDPPEMMTVLRSKSDYSLHFGYFRDDPKEMPDFMVQSGGFDEVINQGFSNLATLQMIGDNLFACMFHHVQRVIQKADPFKQTALHKFKERLHVQATMKNPEKDFSLDIKTSKMKARDKKKVTQTFHGVGLVVPYDKKTEVGYREVPETAKSLKQIFRNVVEAEDEDEKNKALDVLQELITNVQYANDEGDPGMGLELGLDAFVFGGKSLVGPTRHLLTVGYDLVGRSVYGNLVKAHLLRRDTVKFPFDANY